MRPKILKRRSFKLEALTSLASRTTLRRTAMRHLTFSVSHHKLHFRIGHYYKDPMWSPHLSGPLAPKLVSRPL